VVVASSPFYYFHSSVLYPGGPQVAQLHRDHHGTPQHLSEQDPCRKSTGQASAMEYSDKVRRMVCETWSRATFARSSSSSRLTFEYIIDPVLDP
jgi:hypothetical protein